MTFMVTTLLKGNDMIKDSYGNLMSEVECINKAYGWSGVLDAIVYIKTHEIEYEGTRVYTELQQFMQEGARLFAPKRS